MKDVFITDMGTYLPNAPISNEVIEDYLGQINGKKSVAKSRILAQNGIKQRYYAIDQNQQTTHTNAQLAAKAVEQALQRSHLSAKQVQLLSTGTTQGDLLVPGFASMVHSELPFPNCEIASFQSVCASGMMALKHAYLQLKSEEKQFAVSVGSELASRLFKASRFEAQNLDRLSFDAEFLRWMLSDGAGAMILQNHPREQGLSLRVKWIEIKSHAATYPLCMYAGVGTNKQDDQYSWMDFPDFSAAAEAGVINLKQDVRQLDQVIQAGVAHYFELIDQHKITPAQVDWLCCHYSSEVFRQPIQTLMEKGGAPIQDDKWFTNLSYKGNTGAASIYIMLEELLYSGKLKGGDQILCMVPESGRFITSFMLLEVAAGPAATTPKYAYREVAAPELVVEANPTSEWLVRQLTQIWVAFESSLLKTPIVRKIHEGTLHIEDYKLLLRDLRQQVIDGSQWISRAASNIDIELFELRSAFIRHTATEHKDYQLLEKNYVKLGESLAAIQQAPKNIGSIALSSYMFQQASKPNPVDLLGSMFIIEGIGKRLAAFWGNMIKDQLGLSDDQVSFFTYHGVADENHFHRLEEALHHPMMNMEVAKRIAQTAKVTARLYRMQLAELGNY